MTMTDEDWVLERQGPRNPDACDHTTCAGCTTCTCHQKPAHPELGTPSPTIVERAPRRVHTARTLETDVASTRRTLTAAKTEIDRALSALDALTARPPTAPRGAPPFPPDTPSLLAQAVHRASIDTDDGLKPASTGPGSTGEPSDLFPRAFTRTGPVENEQWEAKIDTIRNNADALARTIHITCTNAANAYSAAMALRALTHDEAKKLLDAATAATCLNCTRVVGGTRDDRLRAGRCHDCYRYWDSHGRAEERPKELWS